MLQFDSDETVAYSKKVKCRFIERIPTQLEQEAKLSLG